MTSITLVQLVNSALQEIGQNAIMALDDETREARAASRILDFTIHDVLSEHPWNGASKRVKLPRLSSDPSFEFDHAYQLPDDFVRLNYVEHPESRYRIENGTILSNLDEMRISYVGFTKDPNAMGADCRKAISAKLAAKLVQVLKGDQQLYRLMMQAYQSALAEARFQDSSQEGIEQVGGSSWLEARESGVGGSRLNVGIKD